MNQLILLNVTSELKTHFYRASTACRDRVAIILFKSVSTETR